jgi:hypothetical protein
MATSGVETQRAAWNADVNSSIDRIMFVLLSRRTLRGKVMRKTKGGSYQGKPRVGNPITYVRPPS